jgi:uncharacterized protein (DUF305 family)
MRNVFAGLMVVVGLFCGVTLAQNAQRDNPSAAPAQPGQASSSDQQIAACVYGACRNEIEIAKFAESKAKTDEVREFAQRMVRDHTPGCQAMQRLAGQLAADTPTQPRAGGNLDWNNIHKQIASSVWPVRRRSCRRVQGSILTNASWGSRSAST